MQRVSQSEIVVDNVKKNLVQVKSVTGGTVYTREDYETFIYHFGALIKELNHHEIYNISSFGAYIEGVKNTSFDELELFRTSSMQPVNSTQVFKFELKDFIQDEFMQINSIISHLSKGHFTPSLINTIIKSAFVYQYMQSEILEILQKNLAPEKGDEFIAQTKASIKNIVEHLQYCKLI